MPIDSRDRDTLSARGSSYPPANISDEQDHHDIDTSERHGLLSNKDISDADTDHELEDERVEASKETDPARQRAIEARRRSRHRHSESTFLQDRHRWLFAHPFYHPARMALLGLSIMAIISILVFSVNSLIHTMSSHAPGATKPSHSSHFASSLDDRARIWNGTHDWRRTVVMISLDGTKPDYLHQGIAPNLQHLGTADGGPKVGARRAKALKPIFPTLTFPNHWSLLTGLHAESHGIVANDFHAQKAPSSTSGRSFHYTDPRRSWDPMWWRGTPIWASAERSGVQAAVLMWPGPPRTAQGDRAKYFQKYEEGPRWDLNGRLDQITRWLDLPIEKRPQLILGYAPDVDKAAHHFGPDSNEAHVAVRNVDAFVGDLMKEIEKRHLDQIVDLIIVSDHGMTTTSSERLIFLDDILGKDLYASIQVQDGWPSAGLRFAKPEQLDLAEAKLRNASESMSTHPFDVYRRDTGEMPERWHYAADAERIADLWAVPRLGWSITHHTEYAAMNGVYDPIGNHGYDNDEPAMAATFVARGPSFRPVATTSASWNMDTFPNLEIYNLIADILGLPFERRAPNNGTDSFWKDHLVSRLY